MTVTYTNRKGVTYFLNKGVTKTGKPRYTFAREQKSEPVDVLPEGYEIEESINGIVSLVKSRPRLISSEEVAAVQSALDKHPNPQNYRLTLKNEHILIYERSTEDLDSIASIFGRLGFSKNYVREQLQSTLERHARFTPVMRFVLDNHETRDFHAERWRYSGAYEGWIFAGHSGKIDHLAEKLIPYLGTDDFFTLY
jgi:hypothetical protein